jgi:hypothetical protein
MRKTGTLMYELNCTDGWISNLFYQNVILSTQDLQNWKSVQLEMLRGLCTKFSGQLLVRNRIC